MPMYEYQCEKCKKVEEHLQSYDDPAPSCKKCKNQQMTRLISRTSFSLKGEGWYKDHYGLKSSPAPAKEA